MPPCQGGIFTAGTPGSKPTTTIDLIFDSIYSGAVGGTAVALFFLVVDLLDGRPLFTPAMMGNAILYGVAVGDMAEVKFDPIAYFTLAHMTAFVALGAAVTWLVHEVELHLKHPVVVLLVLLRSCPRALMAAPVNAAVAPRVPQQQRATYLSLGCSACGKHLLRRSLGHMG